MSYTAVEFEGWGVTNLEDIIEEIAQSPTVLSQEEIHEELDAFAVTFFDEIGNTLDQNIKYTFIQMGISNMNVGRVTPPTDAGVTIYISRRLAMALQVSYDIVVQQLVAVIEEYINYSSLFSLKPNASIEDFIKKHYEEVYVNSVLY